MRLIIDKGNTRTKVAVYNKEELLSVVAVGRLDVNFIAELYSKYDRDKLCRYLNYVSGLKFTLEIIDGWNEVIGNQHCKTEEGTIELLE